MCDTIVAVGSATARGQVLFGKNSDRDFREAQHLAFVPAAHHPRDATVRLTYAEIEQVSETRAMLLSKPHWIWGAEIGVNDCGVAIGNEAIFTRIEPSFDPGVIGMDYVRLALERAASADEAIHVITSLLSRHGQSGDCGFERKIAYHNAFLVADPHNARVLETVGREWVVTPVDRVRAISNAISSEPPFVQVSPGLEVQAREAGLIGANEPFIFKQAYVAVPPGSSAAYREQRATELLDARSGALSARDFREILRDHAEGPNSDGRVGARLCMHRRDNPLGATTAAWVSELAPLRTVHWVTATAAPCSSIFKPVFLEAPIPAHGPLPGAVEDQCSLWWRHEQLRLALERGAEEEMSVYLQERDALEVRFEERISAFLASDGDPASASAAALVAECWREAGDWEYRWYDRLIPARETGTVIAKGQ